MKKGTWPGTWKVVCDVCGFWYRSDEIKQRWDGLYTCHKDWEVKHPQLYIRIPPETIVPPFVRPDPEDVFINVCTLLTMQGVADEGTADCAQADLDNNIPT